MGAPDFHEPTPGDPVRAADEAMLRRYVSQLGNSFGASMGHAGPEGNQSARFREMPWLRIVKITDVDCNNPWRHAWEEVISDPNDDNAYDTLGNASSKNQSGGIDKWYLITPELTEYIPNDTVMLVTPFFNQDNELTFIGHFIHEPFWSKLTGTNDEDGEYSWTEQEPDGAGKLQDKVDGRTGTLNARDVNGELCIPTDTIVWMVFSEQLTCAGTPEDRYLFEYVPHLDSWFEIDDSPGNTGPVYSATFLIHDGAGDLEPDDPAVETDFLREVNGVTDINLQSDRRVFGHFLGLSDDGDEGTFTKRFAFDRGGATGSGCTDVFKTINADTGTSPVALGCNDELNILGGECITTTGDAVADSITIDLAGKFWEDIAIVDSGGSPKTNSPAVPAVCADTLTLKEGTGITLALNVAKDEITISSSGGGGGCTDAFLTIVADVGTSPVASGCSDTLNILGGNCITTEGDAGSDTITIDLDEFIWKDITLAAGTGSVTGDLTIIPGECFDTLNLVAGDNIKFTGVDATGTITIDVEGTCEDVYKTVTADLGSTNTASGCDDNLAINGDIDCIVTTGTGSGAVTIESQRSPFQGRITAEGSGGSYTVQLLRTDGTNLSSTITAQEACNTTGILVGTIVLCVAPCDRASGEIRFIHNRKRLVFQGRLTGGGLGNNTYNVTPLNDGGTTDSALAALITTVDEINGQEYLRELGNDSGGSGGDPIVECILEEADCGTPSIAYFDGPLRSMWAEVTVNSGAGSYTVEIKSSDNTAVTGNPTTTAKEISLKANIPVGTPVRCFFERGVWNSQVWFECSCQFVSSSDVQP